jgi:Leucine-rich repeat (LRR) protein
LTRLNLNGNQISDISPLLENSGLGEGDEIYLKGNNLDLMEGSEDMQNIGILEDRGVKVSY